MPRSKLTVKLAGAQKEHGAVVFGDFRDFCGSLALCLRKVECVVSAESRLHYFISDAKTGSVTMTLEPRPSGKGQDTGADVVRLFVETVNQLEEGGQVDPRFSREDLKAFRRLAEPLNRRLSGVWIAGRKITTQFIANVDKIVGSAIPSHGSVSGRLERLNLHNRSEFALYLPLGGFVVTCVFPDELRDKVIAAITRTVTVSGTLVFRPDSPFPEKVQVQAMEIHPPDAELPKLGALRGLLQGGIGNMTSVEFINSIRDE